MDRYSVELIDVVKVFRDRSGAKDHIVAVDGVSLKLIQGELLTLLGPSGCGKTTTLRMVGGFEMPTSGKVVLDGKVINDFPPHKRDTAMVFQSYALFPHLTVFENVAYGLRMRKMEKDAIVAKARHALSLVGLEGLEERQPGSLSGGQQQRVALARALVVEPKVLLLDEPLSNLDARLRAQMRIEIRKIQQALNITSMYVTHDQEEAMSLSDRIAVMNHGRIEQIGTPQEVYAKPVNRFVADFMGRKTTFLDGKVMGFDENLMHVSVMDAVLPFERVSGINTGDDVELVVRSETVDIVPPGCGTFPGRIIHAAYFGSQVLYEVDLLGTTITAEIPDPQEREMFTQGSEVGINLKTRSIHVLPRANNGQIT
ncbi:MAG TPA: ABC transporter ATP-binding protein [Bacillota bacterium]|jgi:iron(III) transport system ATP-binding protein|nr:ABC transporter ATP-binding protein [Bacillota bacterium]HOJ58299.1 ABC transporter ATP-binding protein [Bacillota bacterium]HPZ92079.1 ABC transporter ATP-binding protein [Bacillota bacterium]